MDKNFANMVLFFLKSINKNLKEKNWVSKNSSHGVYICLNKLEYGYSWKAVSLIQKTLSDNIWDFQLIQFSKKDDNTYTYIWQYKKKGTI